ncbi:MAG: hypothetical protein HN348_11090 [Proteobacteria bacterium]|jgi:hypothetical protein|nr:hypothetical protein [Pseudomonadota bacterium]
MYIERICVLTMLVAAVAGCTSHDRSGEIFSTIEDTWGLQAESTWRLYSPVSEFFADAGDAGILFVDDDWMTTADGVSTFSTINDAMDSIEGNECGYVVVVGPGSYDETVDLESVDCDGSESPFVISAAQAPMEIWTPGAAGAGALVSDCVPTNPADPSMECETEPDSDCYEVECNDSVVSWVHEFFAGCGQRNSGIRILGFETHYIGFGAGGGAYDEHLGERTYLDPEGVAAEDKGCVDCAIVMNFFNVSYQRGLQMSYSDRAIIAGNHFYRLGGDGTGDQDLGMKNSRDYVLKYNNLYGSGAPNGDGLTDGLCTDTNWKTTCKEDFQGTDGWTVSAAWECGAEFHHNKVYDKRYLGTEINDGDGTDLKFVKCSDNPIRIHHNIYERQQKANLTAHIGASGVRIYNNIFRDALDNDGIALQVGQECSYYCTYCGCDEVCNGSSSTTTCGTEEEIDTDSCDCSLATDYEQACDAYFDQWDGGHMSDIAIYNNIIESNGRDGIHVHHVSNSQCVKYGLGYPDEITGVDMEYRSLTNVLVFNNTIANNAEYAISWNHVYRDNSWATFSPYSAYAGTIKIADNIMWENGGGTCKNGCFSPADSSLGYGALDSAECGPSSSMEFSAFYVGYKNTSTTYNSIDLYHNISEGGVRVSDKCYDVDYIDSGNLDDDPLLADVVGGDYTIGDAASPAIDVGLDWSNIITPLSTVPTSVPIDFADVVRPHGAVDIGAYEY